VARRRTSWLDVEEKIGKRQKEGKGEKKWQETSEGRAQFGLNVSASVINFVARKFKQKKRPFRLGNVCLSIEK